MSAGGPRKPVTACDLPNYGFLKIKFTLLRMYLLLWNGTQMQAESSWLSSDSYNTIAPIACTWLAD